MRITKEQINKKIKDRGYIPLEFEFKRWRDNIIFKDINGYKYVSSWENFKSSKNFKAITYNNPFSVENAKLYLKIHNIPMNLLSDKINTVSQPLLFEGECGHELKLSWNKMKSKKYYLCERCYKVQKGLNNRTSPDKIITLFKNKGYILLESPKRTDKSILCEDKDGYLGRLSYNNLRLGKTFDPFSSKNLFTISNIRHYLKLNNMDIEILSKNYINCEDSLLWRCSCGNTFFKKWDYIRSERGWHCDECNIKSNLEIKVNNYLKEIKEIYETQYVFIDCGNIRPYPFDFYLQKYNLCIEVDGEQHEKPVRFGGMPMEEAINKFVQQQERDKIKTEYCKNNNINLLRISYREINNKTYKNKINQWLK